MHRGHDPRAIDEYPWKDVEAYLTAFPELLTIESPFAE